MTAKASPDGIIAPPRQQRLRTSLTAARRAAPGKLSKITHQQAAILTYNDAFHFVGIARAISMLAVRQPLMLRAGATDDRRT